ncbi:AfsR/SARP family transcriptional regulator [Catenulispora yoronensis]|uniref:AfsR/SARP family transcriptional regulator n=1 Tax=Catenulispora yoronensis TaxID=450799 RepID=UPI0031D89D7A
MQYKLLGPVGLRHQERFELAGSPKEQAVLAALLMERGRAVPTQTLADRLWDDEPPAAFRSTLQAYVSRLRRRLREAGETGQVITGGPAGYRIDIPVAHVDVHCFDMLISQAQSHVASNPTAAQELFRQAETLWSGEPLAGLNGSWARTVRRILTDKRRASMLRRIELDLQQGASAAEAVLELSELAEANRTDERIAALLMTALDNDGRTADALAVYREMRKKLQEQTGTGPRPELRMLHQRLLNGSAPHKPAAAPQQSPQQPIDTVDPGPDFVSGRDDDLQVLISAVTADLAAAGRGARFALDGLAGIGKTALVLQAADLLRSRCPDGALQINLHAHDHHLPPLDSREALTQLLDALGTPSHELGRADTVPALTALWRKHTSGRRLLLVLDDVQDAAQIEPLIPPAPGTITLITSRRRLTGLPGLRQHTLAPLSDEASAALLAHITGRTLTRDEDLDRYTRSCGGLALAITLTAGHLLSRPVWTVGDLVARFSMTSQALADDPLTGPIHTAFAMSYRALDETLQDLLYDIAAHPGPDIGLPAAAAMARAGLPDTDARLDALVDHRLLEHTGAHRYRLHDLLRQYMLTQRERKHGEAVLAGVVRAITFYSDGAARADHAQNPRRRALNYPTASQSRDGLPLDTPEQARRWLDEEYLNLATLINWGAQPGQERQVGLIAHVLAHHLDRRGRWHQALDHIKQALTTTSSIDPAADTITARLLTDQAGLYARADDLGHALDTAHAALSLWTVSDDHYGLADTYFQIGRIHDFTGRLDQAIAAFRTAAELYRGLGDSNRVAAAENLWAVAAFQTGHREQALALCGHALDLARHDNDLATICDILICLGEMHRQAGHQAQALAYTHEARNLSGTLDDPLVIATVGNNLGAIYQHAGDHHRALASFEIALEQFRTISNHRGEVDCLIYMANSHTHLADHQTALAKIRSAAVLAETTHDTLLQAQVRLTEGDSRRATNNVLQAINAYQHALDLALQAGALVEQSKAHHALSTMFTTAGSPGRAAEHLESGLAIDLELAHEAAPADLG